MMSIRFTRRLDRFPQRLGVRLSSCGTLSNKVDISPEVKDALSTNKPVVALESTIITHGMPYPTNLETALHCEQIVRNEGAIPATIGIVAGRVKVGLKKEELQRLAQPPSQNRQVIKASRRDFPYILSKGLDGGTTVAGTVIVADMVGIKVFVTGGIGGVHRDVESTMDISADLTEMSRSSVTVVSSGVKSILDIGRTLECLETFGVTVVAYSETNSFPAFYTRDSGHRAPYNVNSCDAAADLIANHHHMNLKSGILLAVPVPAEYETMNFASMEIIIKTALAECERLGVKGKAVTPFLLGHVNQLTGGKSLITNIALIKNNAAVGSRVAVKLHTLISRKDGDCKSKLVEGQPTKVEDCKQANKGQKVCGPKVEKDCCPKAHVVPDIPKSSASSKDCCKPLVVGGSNLDCIVSAKDMIKMDGRMLIGKVHQTGGGVGRNIAEALTKLDFQPVLLSMVGNDQTGNFLLQLTSAIDCSEIKVVPGTTASCVVVIDNTGENVLLLGDMSIHKQISPEYISDKIQLIDNSSIVAVDGNLSEESLKHLIGLCSERGKQVWYEPTDVTTAGKAFKTEYWKKLSFISPNFMELQQIIRTLGTSTKGIRLLDITKEKKEDVVEAAFKLARPLAEHIDTIMVTLGRHGIVMVRAVKGTTGREVIANHYQIPDFNYKIASVSGAGDCSAAAYIKGLLLDLPEEHCIALAFSGAIDSLQSVDTVPPKFSTDYKQIINNVTAHRITA